MKLKSRKAQFFILAAFAIVSIVYFMARWIEPFTIIDISQIALQEEAFFFNNIKESSIYAVNGSKSCDDLRYNLEEYKHFVESYAIERGYKLDFNYTMTPCYVEPPLFPVVVEAKMRLKSKNMDLGSNFSMEWIPY